MSGCEGCEFGTMVSFAVAYSGVGVEAPLYVVWVADGEGGAFSLLLFWRESWKAYDEEA